MVKTYDAGGDWVTLTYAKSQPEYIRAERLCEIMVQEMTTTGEEIKPFGVQGYIGFQVGKLFCGTRSDGLMIQATSEVCKYVEEKVRASGIQFHCTRYDLQVTVQTTERQHDYAQRMCSKIAFGNKHDEGEERVSVNTYQNSGRYSGLTLGSRRSARYLRFYDKTLEQKGMIPDNLWRFEVEFKRELAQKVWMQSMSAARSYWLALSLVPVEFEVRGFDISWAGETDGVERPTSYHKTTKDKKLGWLENHVRGSVRWLIEQGHEDEVRAALGL